MSTKEPRFHGEVTEKSHKNMSKIRGKNTSIEVVLERHYGIGDFVIGKITRDCQEVQILF